MTGLLEALARETGLRGVDLVRIMNRAPVMYKTYEIAKRSGGMREISQPAREVKFVQRALINVLLKNLPVHASATAYRPDRSILHNALPHAGDGPILKIDLKDFFTSIRSMDWVSYCRDQDVGLSEEEIQLTARLLFHKRKGGRVLTLAIGAPSSPVISNILMYKFDQLILDNLENDKVVYTRYADDMTFSAPRTGYLNGVMKTVASTIRGMRYPKVSINRKKTTHVTRKFGRTVTGLTLSNDGRVTIGRQSKRKLHAAVYNFKSGKLSEDEAQIAAGMLAYVNAVEPTFLNVLREKYGADIVLRLQKSVQKGRTPDAHRAPLALSKHSIAAQDLSSEI